MRIIDNIIENIKIKAKRFINDLLVEPHVSIKEIDQQSRSSAEPNVVHIYVGQCLRDDSSFVVSRIICFPAHWKKEPYKMCESKKSKLAKNAQEVAVYAALRYIDARIAEVNGDPIRIITEEIGDCSFYEEELDRLATFYNKNISVDQIDKNDKRYKILEEAKKLAIDF